MIGYKIQVVKYKLAMDEENFNVYVYRGSNFAYDFFLS